MFKARAVAPRQLCSGWGARWVRPSIFALQVALLLAGAPGSIFGGQGEARELFVSPDPGIGSDVEGDGTLAHPFLTIAHALGAARSLQTPDPGASFKILLLPGRYAGDLEAAGEVFPVELPGDLRRVELAAARPGDGQVLIERADSLEPLLRIARSAEGVTAREIVLRGLELVGGSEAVLLEATGPGELGIKIASCRIRGQSAQSLRVAQEGPSLLQVVLEENTLELSRGGLSVTTGRDGLAEIEVRGCVLGDLGRYGVGAHLGSGIDLYLERRSSARLRVEGCHFRGMASALQITEAVDDPDFRPLDGEVLVEVVNNLVDGLAGPGGGPGAITQHGIYLSLDPAHRTSVLVAHNTFVGLGGPVVFRDDLERSLAEGRAPVAYQFLNNLCAGIESGSEFEEELFAERHPDQGLTFPGPGLVISGNRLERSRRLTAGTENSTADPLFVAPESGDFALRPDSPLRDLGVMILGATIDRDLRGSCRVASTSCAAGAYRPDPGAFEIEGYCAHPLARFVRGDCNTSLGRVDLSDAVFGFSYLFLGGAVPGCLDACDANDDGILNLSDGIYTLSFLFGGGTALPGPFPEAGTDTSRDCLEACGSGALGAE